MADSSTFSSDPHIVPDSDADAAEELSDQMSGIQETESGVDDTTEELISPLQSSLPTNTGAVAATTMLTAFTCFPQLPAELRLRVWNFAIAEPRKFLDSNT